MELDEFNDLIDGLVCLFEDFFPDENIDADEVAWCVSRLGEGILWMLEDLHIVFDFYRGKIFVAGLLESSEYKRRKVKVLWDTMKEIGRAD